MDGARTLGSDALSIAVLTYCEEVDDLLDLNDGDRVGATRDWFAREGVDFDGMLDFADSAIEAARASVETGYDGQAILRGLVLTGFELAWVTKRPEVAYGGAV